MKTQLLKLPFVLLIALLISLGIFALFNLRYNQTFISPVLLPTAEYLYKAPIQPPSWMRIIPSPGSVLPKDEGIEIRLYICNDIVGIKSCNESESPLHVAGDSYDSTGRYRLWSNFYINGRESNFLLFIWGGSVYGTLTSSALVMKPKPVLLPGYHLFKIEPANSQEQQNNPDPKFSYEWAYRVE